MTEKNIHLTYSELQCFVTVVDYRSLGKAAACLNLSVARVSKIIKKIEGHVGACLFKRTQHGVDLNERGDLLVSPMRRTIRSFEETYRAIRLSNERSGKKIRLGIDQDFHHPDLYDVITNAARSTGDFLIEINRAPASELMIMFLNGCLDHMVVPLFRDELNESRKTLLKTDVFRISARANHPLFDLLLDDEILLEQFNKYGWILPKKNLPSRAVIDERIESLNFPIPDVKIELSQITQPVTEIMRKSKMIGYASDQIVRESRGEIESFGLKDLEVLVNWSLVSRSQDEDCGFEGQMIYCLKDDWI